MKASILTRTHESLKYDSIIVLVSEKTQSITETVDILQPIPGAGKAQRALVQDMGIDHGGGNIFMPE